MSKTKTDYRKRITSGLKRESERGTNLTSKFLKVIHDIDGGTRAQITKELVQRKALDPVKYTKANPKKGIKKGEVDLATTAKKLNFLFSARTKNNLFKKEAKRNATGHFASRNSRYVLTDEGKKAFRTLIAPNFRKWAA